MVRFNTAIHQFAGQGEKTGWTYIPIPAEIADRLRPGNKKTFRVKGKIDDHPIGQIALLPMGNGDFILALNRALRKAIHKKKGSMVDVQLEEDVKKPVVDRDLQESLADVPPAKKYFMSLAPSHQLYFSKWIASAKTPDTKAKRIGMAVAAMERNLSYGEMLRMNRINSQLLISKLSLRQGKN